MPNLVTYVPAPMLAYRDQITVTQRMSLADIVSEFEIRGEVVLILGDQIIPAEHWSVVYPKPGVPIVVVGRPAGRAAQFLPAVLAVAAGAVSFGVGFTLFGLVSAATAASIVSAGTSIVASLAVSALFRPSSQNRASFERPQSYQIGATRNTFEPNSAIPVLYGINVRYAPKFMAIPFNESAFNQQYVRMALCHSAGRVFATDPRIGQTDLTAFKGVRQSTIQNFDGSAPQQIYSQDVAQEAIGIELLPEVDVARVTAPDAVSCAIDLEAPQGLFVVNENGSVGGRSQAVDIAYRVNGTSDPFVDIAVGFMRERGARPVRQTARFEFPAPGQYEVRVRRRPYGFSEGGSAQSNDRIDWVNLRTFQEGRPFKLDEPVTASFLQIQASEQLNGTPDTITYRGSRLVKSYNGTIWVDAVASSNPADIYRDLLQGPGNTEPVSDDQLDLSSIQGFHDYCREKGWTFKAYLDTSGRSVAEVAGDVCAAGRGSPAMINGKHGVIWEEEGGLVEQHFSPDNSEGYSSSIVYRDPLHALRVRYLDETRDFTEQFITVYADGYTEANATNIEDIEFPGVTTSGNCYRHARYYIAETILRREEHTITVDAQSLAVRRGSLVHLAHDVTKIGTAQGLVKSVAGNLITLNTEATLEIGASYNLRWRPAEGGTDVRSVLTGAGTTRTLEIENVLPLPAPGDLFMLGEVGRESKRLKVKEIRPDLDFRATLVLVDEAPEMYAADTQAIPAFNPLITEPLDPQSVRPRDLTYLGETFVEVDGRVTSKVRFSWAPPDRVAPAGYRVTLFRDDDEQGEQVAELGADAAEVEIADLEAGTYRLGVRALLDAETVLTSSAFADFTLSEADRVPPDPSSLDIAIDGRTATLNVPPDPSVLAKFLRVRFSEGDGAGSWEESPILVDRSEGNVVRVPARVGTYFVKWVSPYDLPSAGSQQVVARTPGLLDFNVVETQALQPDWTGNSTGIVQVGSEIRLDTGIDIFAQDDVFALSDMFETTTAVQSEGTFESSTVTDLGAVFTFRVLPRLVATAESAGNDIFALDDIFAGAEIFGTTTDEWNAQIELRTTDDDPALGNWSDWKSASIGEETARAVQVRVVITSQNPLIQVRVLQAELVIDMPDRDVVGQDIAVSASGLTISFFPAFQALKFFATDLQDGVSGDHVVVLSKSKTSVSLEVRNSGNAPTTGTIDYLAKGYGSIAA